MARLLCAGRPAGASRRSPSRTRWPTTRGRVLGGRGPGPRDPQRASTSTGSTPGPGDGAWLDAPPGCPRRPRGRSASAWSRPSPAGRGTSVFLDAVARVPADLPARFYVVGGPIYRSAGSQVSLDELKAQAARLGLGDRVGFAGHQADPAAALRALDVVVHASTRPEPFGRVIVEGMACGRAVVAMAEGGAAELFEDGEDALGCPPRRPRRAGRRASRRLIADPGLRDRLGRAGAGRGRGPVRPRPARRRVGLGVRSTVAGRRAARSPTRPSPAEGSTVASRRISS